MQPALDRCFAGDTVEAILDALAAEAASDSASFRLGGRDPRRAPRPPAARPNRSDICKWQKRWHLYLVVDTSLKKIGLRLSVVRFA